MIQLRSLGGVEVTDQTGRRIALRSRKHLGLFLFLASSEVRILSRQRLCALFWSSDESRARHSLSQAIYDINQRLGKVVRKGSGEDVVFESDRIAFDVRTFEEAVKQGEFSAAVAAYEGPFGDNLIGTGSPAFERWLDAERTRLSRLAEMATRRFIEECEGEGRWGEMCVAASRLTALAPLDEEAHRMFMRALWLQGDPLSALNHFEQVLIPQSDELVGGISPETVDLVAQIRDKPLPAAPSDRDVVDREPPFVGRETEFKRLQEAVSSIGSGVAMVVVSGEQGIGKSRLLKELAKSLLPQSVRILWSRCYQAEEALPCIPVLEGLSPLADETLGVETPPTRYQSLRRLLPKLREEPSPELPNHVDSAAWQQQLYEEVVSFVATATEREPIIWLVDDAQWLDQTSAGLFHYLTRRLSKKPFLLVVASRPRAGSDGSAVPVWPAVGSRPDVACLILAPLPSARIQDIVSHSDPGGLSHDVATLAVRLAAGNPYYALEVLQAATASSEWAKAASDWDPLNDDRLRRLLGVRVEGLGIERLRILESVAVLERYARPALVAAVAGLTVEDLAIFSEELYRRGLLADREGRVAFSDDPMKEHVYAQMTALRRAALHLSAGRVLERELDTAPGALATHFFHGDDWNRSFGYAMEAVRQARDTAGHAEAAHFAAIATEAAPGLAERQAALETRGSSSFAAGDLAAAAEAYLALIRLSNGPPERTADIWLRLAEVEISRCGWPAARRALGEAALQISLINTGPAGVPLGARHAELTLKLGFLTDDFDAARLAAEPINRLYELIDTIDPKPTAVAFRVLSTKAIQETVTGSSREALSIVALANEHLDQTDPVDVARHYSVRGYVRTKLADWDAAEADLRQALSAYQRLGDLLGTIRVWNNLVCIATERGHWADSKERLEVACQLQASISGRADTSLSLALNRANLLFYQGLLGAAREEYARASDLAQVDGIDGAALEVNSCLGLIALQRGDSAAATEQWQRVCSLRGERGLSGGAQETFKLSWFSAWMSLDPTELERAVDEERDRDIPSYAKTLCLHSLLRGDASAIASARAELDALGMRWFSSFAARWYRTASRLSDS